MKPFVLAGAVLGLGLGLVGGTPARALEHRATIPHAAGDIAADYRSAARISYRQTGTPGVGGRTDSLRCRWSVDMEVERRAVMPGGSSVSRKLVEIGVLAGSERGWCHASVRRVERLVESGPDALHRALAALIARDRGAILAEAEVHGTSG